MDRRVVEVGGEGWTGGLLRVGERRGVGKRVCVVLVLLGRSCPAFYDGMIPLLFA